MKHLLIRECLYSHLNEVESCIEFNPDEAARQLKGFLSLMQMIEEEAALLLIKSEGEVKDLNQSLKGFNELNER